eukprot:XP_001690221.1 RNA helicase [Chlamydomonas reinhardtii]
MPAAGAGGGGGAAGAGGGGGAAGGFARLPPMQQAAELEKACSHSHVPYFASCTLNMWVNRPDGGNGGGGGFGKKRKGGSGGGGSRKGWGQGGGGDSDMDDGDDGPSTSAPKASYYLIVPNVRNRVKHSRRHDLWVISSNPLLQGGVMGAAGDGARAGAGRGWWAVCRSVWHGPDRDGKFEVEMLTAPPPGCTRSQTVYALRGPEVQSEVLMVQMLESMGTPPAAIGAGIAATAAAAVAAARAGSSGTQHQQLLPLLRHLLALQPPEKPLDLAAAAAGAVGAAAAAPGRAFKKPRVQVKDQDAGADRAAADAGESEDEEGGDAEWQQEEGETGRTSGKAVSNSSKSGGAFDPVAIAREHIARFRLNSDQARVLMHCASWFLPHPGSGSGNSNARGSAQGGGGRRTGKLAGAGAKAGDAEEASEMAELCDDEEDMLLLGDEDDDLVAAPDGGSGGRAGGGKKAAQPRRAVRRCVLEDDEDEEDGGEPGHAAAGGTGAGGTAGAWEAAMEVQAPVCLVHGPFGSGKSSLLVALICMLVQLGAAQAQALQQRAAAAAAGRKRAAAGRKASAASAAGGTPLVRVLLASHTNVAVDRVLVGLQDAGFGDFLRLGSVDRIAKPVLHRSLRAGGDDSGRGDAAAELRRALKDASPADAAYINAELAALAAGAEKQRRRALRTCPVVGATICSLLQPSSEDHMGSGFTVVVLDECSQMTEPLCLVPLLRAKARFLVAAGDPQQLPPVIASPANLTAPAPQHQPGPASGLQWGPGAVGAAGAGSQRGHPGAATDSLLRPLFVRLCQLGHAPHLLSYQYRCHPRLSSIANAAFYEGRLRDGVTPADRPPLLVGLPPLVFVESGGQAAVDAYTRSSYNTQEAQLVSRMVAALLAQGVSADEVGVICFYRAQVGAIRRALQQADAGGGSSRAPGEAGRGGTAAGGAAGAGDQQDGLVGEGGGGRDSGMVQVATVDSFQGAEKEVVILATTVSRAADFASDAKRLNVALTRGRRHLLVVGCPGALCQTSHVFEGIIRTCQEAMRRPPLPQPPAAAAQAAAQQQHQSTGYAGGGGGGGGGGDALYVSGAGLLRLLEGTACEQQQPGGVQPLYSPAGGAAAAHAHAGGSGGSRGGVMAWQSHAAHAQRQQQQQQQQTGGMLPRYQGAQVLLAQECSNTQQQQRAVSAGGDCRSAHSPADGCWEPASAHHDADDEFFDDI